MRLCPLRRPPRAGAPGSGPHGKEAPRPTLRRRLLFDLLEGRRLPSTGAGTAGVVAAGDHASLPPAPAPPHVTAVASPGTQAGHDSNDVGTSHVPNAPSTVAVAPVGDAHPAGPVGASQPGSGAGNNAPTSPATPPAEATSNPDDPSGATAPADGQPDAGAVQPTSTSTTATLPATPPSVAPTSTSAPAPGPAAPGSSQDQDQDQNQNQTPNDAALSWFSSWHWYWAGWDVTQTWMARVGDNDTPGRS